MASIARTIQRDISGAFEREHIYWQTTALDPLAVVHGTISSRCRNTPLHKGMAALLSLSGNFL